MRLSDRVRCRTCGSIMTPTRVSRRFRCVSCSRSRRSPPLAIGICCLCGTVRRVWSRHQEGSLRGIVRTGIYNHVRRAHAILSVRQASLLADLALFEFPDRDPDRPLGVVVQLRKPYTKSGFIAEIRPSGTSVEAMALEKPGS
jgi:hypothetical protein